MPNFYTHLRFGKAVLPRLEPELQQALNREMDSFLLGNFGPDPLYFAENSHRQAALSLHAGSGQQALSHYQTAMEQNRSYARSFAAGYFLHFLLDSQLHPLIYGAMEETGLSHRNLEGELDRLLLSEDRVAPQDAFPDTDQPEVFFMTAARMVPGTTPGAYATGLNRFRLVSLTLHHTSGTPLRYAANGLGRITGIRGLHGAILGREPDPAARLWLHRFQGRYEAALDTAPVALTEFLRHGPHSPALSSLLAKNFSGKKVL